LGFLFVAALASISVQREIRRRGFWVTGQRRWSKAKTGEGQVVLLSGEAGIGKCG
jgi:hypothetical protein